MFGKRHNDHYHNVIGSLLVIVLLCFVTPVYCFIKSNNHLLSFHHSLIIPASATSASSSNNDDNDRLVHHDERLGQVTYSEARDVRLKDGHSAAVPLYRSLLSRNVDVTAASRIAAANSSPWRHDQSCPVPTWDDDTTRTTDQNKNDDDKIREAIKKFRHVLEKSNFNNQHVQRLFGIPSKKQLVIDGIIDEKDDDIITKDKMLAFAQSPIYLKPVSAGTQSELPSLLDDILSICDDDDDDNQSVNDQGSYSNNPTRSHTSLKCIVSLFLLGFSVPKEILTKCLIGGQETISLMEYLGLLFPCETDASIMVPYVHMFPLDVDIIVKDVDTNASNNFEPKQKSIVLITDCHPNVLSRTTVGEMEEGAVMYIGPDSLALVQQLPLQIHISSLQKDKVDNIGKAETETFRILDFCTGSGIQAISTMLSLSSYRPDATAVFVDVNDRALRFARFNALLNGIQQEKISTINGDIVSGDLFTENKKLFDIILANPPFIPVPGNPGDVQSDDSNCDNDGGNDDIISEVIKKRYGLFSSGGSSGEEVLRAIISMSPRLLRPESGMIGIVSEFMNAPGDEIGLELLENIQQWWKDSTIDQQQHGDKGVMCHGKGVLLTNQYPVTAQTYALRRADNQIELNAWLNHLDSCQIRSVSPGLLFVRSIENDSKDRSSLLDLSSELMPKTKWGSIWTPFNFRAIQYSKKIWTEITKT